MRKTFKTLNGVMEVEAEAIVPRCIGCGFSLEVKATATNSETGKQEVVCDSSSMFTYTEDPTEENILARMEEVANRLVEKYDEQFTAVKEDIFKAAGWN